MHRSYLSDRSRNAAPFFRCLMLKLWYLILPITVFLVSCFDLGATLYFGNTCNYFEEANPVAAHVWGNYGETGLIIFKLIVTLVSCLAMGWILTNKEQPWRIFVTVFGITTCGLLMGWWIFWIF